MLWKMFDIRVLLVIGGALLSGYHHVAASTTAAVTDPPTTAAATDSSTTAAATDTAGSTTAPPAVTEANDTEPVTGGAPTSNPVDGRLTDGTFTIANLSEHTGSMKLFAKHYLDDDLPGYGVDQDTGQMKLFAKHYLDDDLPGYGVDQDEGSCFTSGRGDDAWWKMVLSERAVIKGLLFSGYWVGELLFRIGNAHSKINLRDGHQVNMPCRRYNLDGAVHNMVIECKTPLLGRVISMEGTVYNAGTNTSTNLKVCDLQILV